MGPCSHDSPVCLRDPAGSRTQTQLLPCLVQGETQLFLPAASLPSHPNSYRHNYSSGQTELCLQAPHSLELILSAPVLALPTSKSRRSPGLLASSRGSQDVPLLWNKHCQAGPRCTEFAFLGWEGTLPNPCGGLGWLLTHANSFSLAAPLLLLLTFSYLLGSFFLSQPQNNC